MARRFTSAYSSLASRMVEIDVLRRFAAAKERKDPIKYRHEINALCRGAVVLLSGHLEGFIKELGEVALDSLHTKNVSRAQILTTRFYYHISKTFMDEMQNTSDPEKLADKVFTFLESDAAFWSKAGPFPSPIPVERFNSGFSNPASAKIRAYFNRFGYSNYSRDLQARLKANYTPITNLVDHLVHTRNKIAHGDSAASKTPTEVRKMASMVRAYCLATDTAFARWWKKQFCTIR